MSYLPVRPRSTALLAAMFLLVLALAPGLSRQTAYAIPPAGPGFGASTMVDDQREGGEPDIRTCGPDATWSYGNCGLNNPYGSAPYGFSTTSSFVWRSEDQAQSFKLVPSNNTTGKPDACPGGGDTDLAVSPGATQQQDFLDFIDLQGLTEFSSGISPDGGTSWTCNSAAVINTAVDRQWLGQYKKPTDTGSIVYLDYDGILQSTVQCATVPGAFGNALTVQESTDKGLTYNAPVIVDCNDGIAGNMQVNQQNGYVYAAHTGYSPQAIASTAGVSDSVVVNRSTDHGLTWTRSVVYSCGATCTTGQDFAVITIDKSGGLYATWSQSPIDNVTGTITGAGHIYYAYSSDNGLTWGLPHKVDNGTTDVNLFPWIVAGDAGKIDVVWYGTTKAAGVTSYDSGKQTTDWYPYIEQSVNATSTTPTFTPQTPVSEHPNHNGGICTMGIGCTAGGDRSLADFFEVGIDKNGAADVIWTDTSNNGNSGDNQSGLIMSARQIKGRTLLGSTSLWGTNVVCSAISLNPCLTDPTGDARYEANGMIGANVPKMDITGTSLNVNPNNTSQLDARINLAGLTSLPNAFDTAITNPYVDYLVSWNYHVPGNGQAQYDSTGNIYYAYLEVNRVTGGITAYDGNTCSISTTHPKFFAYPGQNAIQYSVKRAGYNLRGIYNNGQIDLYIPKADVGNPGSGANLFSVTAHTVDQAGPANTQGALNCLTNRDPNGNANYPGQIFNVYDKSGAYDAVLP